MYGKVIEENRRLRKALNRALYTLRGMGKYGSAPCVPEYADNAVKEIASLTSTELEACQEDDEKYDLSSTDFVSAEQIAKIRELAKNIIDTPIDLLLYDDESQPEVCRCKDPRAAENYCPACGKLLIVNEGDGDGELGQRRGQGL